MLAALPIVPGTAEPADPAEPAAPDPTPLSKRHFSLEEETMRQIKRGLEETDTACVVQVVELIRAITQRANDISVHEMADIVGRDLTTMGHLLRTACSVGYNPEGVEITTLPQAVQLVGYERIRNIAVSLLLLQNADRPWSDDDFEDVASTMVTGALLAEALAEGSKADPGLCFLSAALRSYGHLLLVSFLPDDFREARQHAAEVGERTGFRDIFGTDPVELGRCLLDQAGVPENLLHNLEPAPARLLDGSANTPPETAHLVVDFATGVAELFARSGSRDAFEAEFNQRCARLGRALDCPRDVLNQALASVLRRIDGYRRSLNSPVFASRAVRCIRSFLSGEAFPEIRVLKRLGDDGIPDFVSGRRADEQLQPGLKDLGRLLDAEPLDRSSAWSLTTRLLWRSLDLENCFVLLRRPDGCFLADFGFGTGLKDLRHAAKLSPETRTVFSVSLQRGRDVLIQRPHDPAIAAFVPDWLKPVANGAIIILPVSDATGTFALLVGLAPERHTFALTPKTMEHLMHLRRSLAVLATSERN